MAPKSKKKKVAANPNRGVATTSLPSKSKAKQQEEALQAEAAKQEEAIATAAAAAASDVGNGADDNAVAAPPIDPEEYARQLEEAELHLWFENHKEKVHRDAKKTILRAEMEKRTVRACATGGPLNVNRWMDENVINEILGMAKAEGTLSNVAAAAVRKDPESFTLKLWELQVTLQSLGFSEEQVKAVIIEQSIYDFDEALIWLGTNYEEGDMPSLVHAAGKRLTAKSTSGSSQSSPGISGTSTPIPPATPSSAQAVEIEEGISKLSMSPSVPATSVSYSSSEDNSDDMPGPEELIRKFIEYKMKLLKLTGGDGVPVKGKKKGKKQADNIPPPLSSADPGRIAYYERKIAKLEADPLFNKRDASEAWAEEVRKHREKVIERLKSGLKPGSDSEDGGVKIGQSAPSVVVSTAQDDVTPKANKQLTSHGPTPSSSRSSMESLGSGVASESEVTNDGFLGGMFEDAPALAEEVSTDSGPSTSVTVRDFSKASESPLLAKKMLEEQIRNKFPGARVQFVDLNAGKSRVYRYKVVLTGTGVQLPPDIDPVSPVDSNGIPTRSYAIIPSISAAGISTLSIESRSISCPTAAQGVNYISTVALFVLFASTSKIYLRLGQAWKDLYSELEEEQKVEADNKEKSQVKSIRAMAENLKGDVEDSPSSTPRSPAKLGKDANSTWGQFSTSARSFDPRVQAEWQDISSTPSYQEMLIGRQQLPMYPYKNTVLEAVEKNQIVIVCGETGSGKSTQTPQYLLEQSMSQGLRCKIYCCQPRRISAISLARRVSAELGETPKDLGTMRSLVGYSIRLEAKHTNQTSLIYCTTGILLRMLETPKELSKISHLIVDEVHERGIDTDFLLIVIKRLIEVNKDLKIVLMSATVDAEKFSKYLDDAPIINFPGRTFPVKTLYLEDAIETTGWIFEDKGSYAQKRHTSDDEDIFGEEASSKSGRLNSTVSLLDKYSQRTRDSIRRMDESRIRYDIIAELLVKICSDPEYLEYSKAMLIFFPGIQEIKKMKDMIDGHPFFNAQRTLVYAMHSSIPPEEQENAFIVPRPGVRKIVLATDIAETGITIPDITAVIDTGKHKEMRFSERQQLSRLVETFISKANAKQRRGRAGRVQNGLCFHLFTKERADSFLSDHQQPEMLRLSLQDLVLRVKICGLGSIEETLASALDPPSVKNVRRAIDALIEVKALTPAEELTPLGRKLALLPLDVYLGKLLLFASVHECIDVAVTIAAMISSKSPFVVPFGRRREADKARLGFKRGDSDLLTAVNAYECWRKVTITKSMNIREYCDKNYMSNHNLSAIEDIKLQLYIQLYDAGFLKMDRDGWLSLNRARFTNYGTSRRNWFEPPASLNRNGKSDDIVNAVIAAAFHPKLLTKEGKRWRNVANTQRISLHPSSVNKGYKGDWLSFYIIMQSSKIYNAHETSRAEDIAIALLCGDAEFKLFAGAMMIDGSNRIRFTFENWKAMIAVRLLRNKVRVLMDGVWTDPRKPLSNDDLKWMHILRKVLTKPPPKVINEGERRKILKF